MTMTIKKSHTIVLLVAVLFAAGSTFFILTSKKKKPLPTLTYQCYNSAQGWGYDVLTDNRKIVIHQPFIPGISGTRGFPKEEQARAAAQIVIENIKSGGMPSLTHQQLQQLGVLHDQSR